MKHRFSLLKCAHMAENVSQNFQRLRGILTHPAWIMGIRANGHDFTTEFLKAPQKIR